MQAAGTCLIVQPIEEAGLALLRAVGLVPRPASALDPETLAREAADCVAVITRNAGFPAAAIAAAPRLRVISVHGTGTDLVAIAAALGMKVLAYGPTRPDGDFAAIGAERAATLPDLLGRADVVSLHVPLTPETRGLIGAPELARMRAGAFLINTARGGLVHEAALAEALAAGTIAGAGLDVVAGDALAADHPLRAHAHAVLTPHVAASTGAALIRMAERAAGQVVDVIAGRRPPHLVNPGVWARRRLA